MKRKLLLADDSPTVKRLVAQTLVGSNFELVSVSNGDAAIEKFNECRPSIVLADIFMPGRNGYEVCDFVKRDPVFAETPVILMVGVLEAYNEVEAKRVGADGRITKPFEPQQLLEIVDSMVFKETIERLSVTGGTENREAIMTGVNEVTASESPRLKNTEIDEETVEEIVSRVVKEMSNNKIEKVVWDIAPRIVRKIVREELKKQNGS